LAQPPAAPNVIPSGEPAPSAIIPPLSGPTPPLPGATAEQRLAALERQNAELLRQLSALQQQQHALANRVGQLPVPPSPENDSIPGPFGRPVQPGRDVAEAGEEGRARVDLSRGIRFFSADNKYRIELHDLTQFDGRFFSVTSPSGTNASQNALHDSFVIPRQRLYFTGQVDEHFDFVSVINRGYGTLDILDSYANFKFDRRFNVRVGRTKTPYTYEYYKIAEGDLVAPERSVFVGNLSPNRQLMVMAFGRLLADVVEYSAGVESGPHRSFQDFNNYKNPFLYLAARPFLYGESDALRHLSLGGSVNFGREDDPLEPNALRTANDETTSPNATNVSPTFLQFRDGVVERGGTAFWSGDVAWYYRSLTALAMYNGGYMTYATPARGGVRVPFEGGSVAVTFFVTGEEITSRKEVEPLRDFNWRSPLQHPGAVELYTRTAYLTAGQSIFTGGLADPRLYSRNALVLDNGVNWYLNRFIQIRADWQHAEFGSPVQIGPGRFTNSTDMFWLRSQLYY
jgi:phosphate-selective porin OprO/OprP